MSGASYNAEQSKGQIGRALRQIHRLSIVFQHVQGCSHCQQIIEQGLSSRTALSGYLLWHAGVAEEGNSREQQ